MVILPPTLFLHALFLSRALDTLLIHLSEHFRITPREPVPPALQQGQVTFPGEAILSRGETVRMLDILATLFLPVLLCCLPLQLPLQQLQEPQVPLGDLCRQLSRCQHLTMGSLDRKIAEALFPICSPHLRLAPLQVVQGLLRIQGLPVY